MTRAIAAQRKRRVTNDEETVKRSEPEPVVDTRRRDTEVQRAPT